MDTAKAVRGVDALLPLAAARRFRAEREEAVNRTAAIQSEYRQQRRILYPHVAIGLRACRRRWSWRYFRPLEAKAARDLRR